jgi:hypothetical protein
MSRIPPHGARVVSAWPASRHQARRSQPAPGERRSLLSGMAHLARALHLVSAARTERGPELAPPPQGV